MPTGARAADSPEQRLADRYAPIVALKQQRRICGGGEGFRPVVVDVVLGREDVSLFREADRKYERVRRAPRALDLHGRDSDHYVDLPGDPITGRCGYQRWFERIGLDVPNAVYAHIAAEEGRPGRLALQYWLYYVYNDFNDKHESDWEMIQLHFDASTVPEALRQEPVEVLYSQHRGAGWSPWAGGKLERVGSHPVTYPGAGSHANYFRHGLWLGRDTAADLGCDDATGPSTRVRPRAVVVPTKVGSRSRGLGWLAYEGHWGQRKASVNDGPLGPNANEQWRRPFTWAETVRRDPAFAVRGSEVVGLDSSEVFCAGVTTASDLLDAFYASPWFLLMFAWLLLGALAIAAAATRWRPAPMRPLEQSRSAGQIVRVSLRVYRSSWSTLLLVSALVLPVVVVAVVATHLLLSVGTVGELVDTVGSEARLTVHVSVLMTIAIQVAALALAVAATTLAVYSLRMGGQQLGTLSAYALVAQRAAPLTGVLVRVTGISTLLALTIVGLPLAIWYLTRTAVAVPACVIERLSPDASIRRSKDMVVGNTWRVGVLTVLTVAVALFAGPLIGAYFLLSTDVSPLLADGIGAAVTVVLMPIVGIVLTLLFLDLRARQRVVAGTS